jgi:hypothetical protein
MSGEKSKSNMAQQPSSTHQFVDVERIEEGVVVLKNQNLRAVLMVSSINFDLKSTDERQAIINNFQQFLNSLDFPLQIVVQSRPLDLTEYYSFLRGEQEKQDNELLRIQISEYVDFVQELVKLANIMSKFFYVVIPYDVAIVKKSGFFQNLLPQNRDSEESGVDRAYLDAKNQLLIRVNQVHALLGDMGLRSVMLSDREAAELFYGLYNPGVGLKHQNFELLLATGDKDKQTE